MKLKSLALVSALSIASFIGSVQAAIIPAMDFATKSGWLADGVNSSTKLGAPYNTVTNCQAGVTNAQNQCGLTFTGASGIADGYTTVNWGADGFVSGLDVVSRSGTLITNGGWVQTGLITHRNQPIPTYAGALKSLQLATVFSIVNPPILSVGANVGIQFTETFNEKNVADCGMPQLSNVGCDDTFLINLNLPDINFVIDGNFYSIKFKLNPLAGVTQSLVNPDGSIVLVTKERDNNQLELMARLEVAAPATISILGLSLIFLGMSRRRKA